VDDSTDPSDQTPPEVTISPADNGHVVRWHQRSGKKGESGRSVTRVASSKEEALGHADEALGGGGSTKSSKKRTSSKRDGQTGSGMSAAEEESGSASSPAAHAAAAHSARRPARGSARRRRSRIGGRR
jgi:hypothetical protein